MSIITLVSSDLQLAQVVRQAGVACSAVPAEALATLAQPGVQQPEVLIVDLRERPQFPPALAALKRQHPATGVLLVVSALEPAVMLEAMRAGVNECVVDPVDTKELQAAVARLQNSATRERGEIFAFVGAKGGVGATTIAVNVATALTKATSDSTLLIDLNVVAGDAAVFLGAEPRFSVLDALENVGRLDNAFLSGLVARTPAGLDLLGAAGRPVTGLDAARIHSLLDVASQVRRYTVLDVPRSDAAALESLELATRIVLVANQELATVRSASRMAAVLRQLYGPHRLSLVVTRSDKRADIGLDDIKRTVGIDVRHAFPSDYRLALQAMNKGRPVVLDKDNELASTFAAFTRDLAGLREPEKTSAAKTNSVFGRLSLRRA